MLGMGFQEAKAGFFDRQAVMQAMDRASLANLSRFGAFVRQTARNSLYPPRKRISSPGSPPSTHVGLLRALILFSYDSGARSVVIGPTVAGGHSGDALVLLEEGGETMGFDKKKKTRKLLHYRARPFMGPALRAEQDKAPALWRDSVR